MSAELDDLRKEVKDLLWQNLSLSQENTKLRRAMDRKDELIEKLREKAEERRGRGDRT